MALYNRDVTKSFYSEIGNDQDTCVYCEKEIVERRTSGKITLDESYKEFRSLKGSLATKRVMKIRYAGNEFVVCNKCVSKINKEVNPEEAKSLNEALTEFAQEDLIKTLPEEKVQELLEETKPKGKGKK